MARRGTDDGKKRSSEWWRSWLLVIAACSGFAFASLQPSIGVADEIDTQHISFDGFDFEGFNLEGFDVESLGAYSPESLERRERSDARRPRRTRPPASTTTTTTAPASDTPAEQRFVELINQERVAGGVSPLTVDVDIQAVARSWSEELSDTADECSSSELRHNPSYASEMPTGWSRVAENVGCGSSVESLHQAFMNSTGHRANILDGDFTHVGVGVAMAADGTMWVTQNFAQY